jgi:hypothetical protein
MVRWPGRVAAGSVSEAIASTMDIHPTILALANVSLPTDRIIDGIDLAPVLFNKKRPVNTQTSGAGGGIGAGGADGAGGAGGGGGGGDNGNDSGMGVNLELFSDKDLGHQCYYMYRAAAAVNASGELFAVRVPV